MRKILKTKKQKSLFDQVRSEHVNREIVNNLRPVQLTFLRYKDGM